MSDPCPHCGQRYWPASTHDTAWCAKTQATKAPAAPTADENAAANAEALKTAQEIVDGDRVDIHVREVRLARALLRFEHINAMLRELLKSKAPVSGSGALAEYVTELEKRASEQKEWEANPKCEDDGVGDAMQVIANELREKFLSGAVSARGPMQQEVDLVFTEDGVYVDTGERAAGGMGNVALKVKDAQAKRVLAAFRSTKRDTFDYAKAYFDLFDLINSDTYAITFQSLGQYRAWLLQSIRAACPDAPGSTSPSATGNPK